MERRQWSFGHRAAEVVAGTAPGAVCRKRCSLSVTTCRAVPLCSWQTGQTWPLLEMTGFPLHCLWPTGHRPWGNPSSATRLLVTSLDYNTCLSLHLRSCTGGKRCLQRQHPQVKFQKLWNVLSSASQRALAILWLGWVQQDKPSLCASSQSCCKENSIFPLSKEDKRRGDKRGASVLDFKKDLLTVTLVKYCNKLPEQDYHMTCLRTGQLFISWELCKYIWSWLGMSKVELTASLTGDHLFF